MTMVMSLATVATHRQTTLHVTAGRVVWCIRIIKRENFAFMYSDVNCGMLFCASNGQYQQTASVGVQIVTVRPSFRVEYV